MSTKVTWHGTREESLALINAIASNCACVFGSVGVRLQTCAAHQMVTQDQRALNGLLFARRMAARLLAEEFSTTNKAPLQS
jgi:hypothetical protein